MGDLVPQLRHALTEALAAAAATDVQFTGQASTVYDHTNIKRNMFLVIALSDVRTM